MSYYKKVMNVLSNGLVMSFEDIMILSDSHEHKTTYVIAAIKKGIKNKTIIQHLNENVKTLYKGHSYQLYTGHLVKTHK